jgi:hypothetical protein
MRRGASDGERGPECAPDPGDGDRDPGRGRSGRRRAGIPIPSRGLMGLVAPAIIGLMALARDDPGREPPPTRLFPGEPGMMALGFALSPDGKTIATTRSDGRVSLRGRGVERILDPRGWPSRGLAFLPDGRSLAGSGSSRWSGSGTSPRSRGAREAKRRCRSSKPDPPRDQGLMGKIDRPEDRPEASRRVDRNGRGGAASGRAEARSSESTLRAAGRLCRGPSERMRVRRPSTSHSIPPRDTPAWSSTPMAGRLRVRRSRSPPGEPYLDTVGPFRSPLGFPENVVRSRWPVHVSCAGWRVPLGRRERGRLCRGLVR